MTATEASKSNIKMFDGYRGFQENLLSGRDEGGVIGPEKKYRLNAWAVETAD